MPSYSVRPAARADASTVAELHVATWKATYKGLLPDAFLDGLTPAMRLPLWRDAIEYGEPQVFMAVADNGKAAGFVGFDRSRDPKTKPTTGEIWALYVTPEHWGQGAGLALWGRRPRRPDRRRLHRSHTVGHAAQRTRPALLRAGRLQA